MNLIDLDRDHAGRHVPVQGHRRLHLLAALAIAFLVTLILLIAADSAFAYTLEKSDEPVTGQLVISPTKEELTMEPGQSALSEVVLINRTGEPLEVKITTEDVEGSTDPDESHVLLGDDSSSFGARFWLEPELDAITIEHGETLTFNIRISIPLDAEPGGHYAALLASTEEESTDGTGVLLEAIPPPLFLITVPGEVDTRASLDNPQVPRFTESGPVQIGVVFNNLGNVHQNPSGVISITNIFGQQVAEIPIGEWLVLPDSVGRTIVDWSDKWHLGPYKVSAQISYGDAGEVLYATSTVWFIPWKIILIGLAAVAVILMLFFLFRRSRRRKQQEIQDELEELRTMKEAGITELTDTGEEEIIAAAGVNGYYEETPVEGEPAKEEERGAGAPYMSRDLVPLNKLLPSTNDTNIVDISDPETRQLIRELIRNEMDLARMYIVEGQNEEARAELHEARTAALKLQLLGEVAMIDDLLKYL